METESRKFNKELSLYIILSGFFLMNALLAEIIGVKFFSLEKVLGLNPANIPFFNGKYLNLDMSVGILIWPFVFIV
jgi:hypothetical protein